MADAYAWLHNKACNNIITSYRSWNGIQLPLERLPDFSVSSLFGPGLARGTFGHHSLVSQPMDGKLPEVTCPLVVELNCRVVPKVGCLRVGRTSNPGLAWENGPWYAERERERERDGVERERVEIDEERERQREKDKRERARVERDRERQRERERER